MVKFLGEIFPLIGFAVRVTHNPKSYLLEGYDYSSQICLFGGVPVRVRAHENPLYTYFLS
jgi:hypothetical protein